MTFSTRLRLTLLVIAIVPAAMITLIVILGTGEQIKRIEYREAQRSCEHFSELLDNTIDRIEQNIDYVADNQSFKLLELTIGVGKRIDPSYKLPLLSLDFLEYADPSGKVFLSAHRPALVGQALDIADTIVLVDTTLFTFENDLYGRHPSVVVARATDKGILYGGVFLDGQFTALAQAVTRSEISFIEQSKTDNATTSGGPAMKSGAPYRQDKKLMALLRSQPGDEYTIRAYFPPSGQDEIFNNFLTGVGAVTVVALALVIIAGFYFSSRARREIGVLTDGALRVASGDFSQPVQAESEGEFFELADSFNAMMRQLTDYRSKLIITEKIAAWQTVGRKVAHEIKNPLTPISIAADDLRRSYIEKQPDFDRIITECTTTIKHEVDRVKRLVDRFASFAEMSASHIRPFSLREFIEEIAALFKADIGSRKLRIVNTIKSSKISADADQMRQVVINLIKNSLEANCGRCDLTFADDNGNIVITIADDGSGFPNKIIKEGVTPYYSTKETGSGLGLLICQRIVLDHNGSMALENIDTGGARVVITLPTHHA